MPRVNPYQVQDFVSPRDLSSSRLACRMWHRTATLTEWKLEIAAKK